MGGHPIGAALLLCLLYLDAKARAAKWVGWLCVSRRETLWLSFHIKPKRSALRFKRRCNVKKGSKAQLWFNVVQHHRRSRSFSVYPIKRKQFVL